MRLPSLITSAALLFATFAHAQNPCTYLTTAQASAGLGTPVQDGTPGPKNCIWHAQKGDGNIYLTLRDGATYNTFKSQAQAAGHMTPVTGLGDDAFFLAGSTASASLYVRKGSQVILLMVRNPTYNLAQNQAAEKTLAAQILPNL